VWSALEPDRVLGLLRVAQGKLRALESEGVAVTARSRHSGPRAAVRVDENAPVDLIFVAADGRWHNLFNKPDDGATQFCVFDTHERFHQG